MLPAETSTVPMRRRRRRAAPRRPARRLPPPAVGIRRPPRIKFTLRAVDQDFFPNLDRLLGGYLGRLDPLRYVTAPDPATARAAAEAHIRPTEENPVIVFRLRPRRALPRRARAHREGRALHLRDHHGSAEPLAPGAGLRADQGGRDPGCPHGPGHVQGALPAGLRELGHGDPARAPPQPRGARRRGARDRQGPRDLQRSRRRVQPATGRQRAVPVRRVGERRLDPLGPERGLLGGAAELPGVLRADPPGRPRRRSSPSRRAPPTATGPRRTRWRGSRTTPAST